MMMSPPTEQLVEDVASVYFGTLGIATKRGVEIDDAESAAIRHNVSCRVASLPNCTGSTRSFRMTRLRRPHEFSRTLCIRR